MTVVVVGSRVFVMTTWKEAADMLRFTVPPYAPDGAILTLLLACSTFGAGCNLYLTGGDGEPAIGDTADPGLLPDANTGIPACPLTATPPAIEHDPYRCCFSDDDCNATPGYTCYGATCAPDQAGRCLETPSNAACWQDSDCPQGQDCLGATIPSLDYACEDFFDVPGVAGACSGPVAGVGIQCGDQTCDSISQFCMGCGLPDGPEVYCLPRTDNVSTAFYTEINARSCSYTSLLIECNDNEDCAAGQECVFSGGEFGYASCIVSGQAERGVFCESSAECSSQYPVCGEYDDFGYFEPYADLLGWLPQACDAPSM